MNSLACTESNPLPQRAVGTRSFEFHLLTPPSEKRAAYLQRVREAHTQDEIVECLTELAEYGDTYPDNLECTDYMNLAINEVLKRPDGCLIIAKLILTLDTKFAIQSAARVRAGKQHDRYHPKIPNPIPDNEINTYFKARNAVESSIKTVAVLERYHAREKTVS